MAWRLGQALLNDPQSGLTPVPRFKMVWDQLREIDHDPEDGSVDGPADRDGNHGLPLGINCARIDTATLQSSPNKVREPTG